MLDKCHHLAWPRVTSLVAIRNQPCFLKLQEADRKGGCRKKKADKKVTAEGVQQKKGGCSRELGGGKSREKSSCGGVAGRGDFFLERRTREEPESERRRRSEEL